MIAMLLLLASCGPKQPKMPWFMTKPPQDTNEFLFERAVFDSQNVAMAERQAMLLASTNMANKLGSKIESLQKLFQEEVGNDNARLYSSAFELATRQIASQQVSGITIHEIVFNTLDDGKTRVYVLVKMPIGDARKQLNDALSQNDEMYIRFKESRAFDELNQNLERVGGNP